MKVETESSHANGSNAETEPAQLLDDEANKQLPAQKKTSCCTDLKVFLAALSFSYFCKALSATIMKSSITQIERRFDLTSSTVGLVDGSFEMGNLLVIAFVSYFGAKLHRPKVIGIGCFIMAVGCLLTAMPHFFMGYYNYERASHRASSVNLTSKINPCLLNQDANKTFLESSQSGCEKETSSYMWIYILLGNMLRGIGETPITPLGISYLDDFAKEENAPVYIASLHTIAMLGPMFGFMLGSLCARLYVDVGFVDLGKKDEITPTSGGRGLHPGHLYLEEAGTVYETMFPGQTILHSPDKLGRAVQCGLLENFREITHPSAAVESITITPQDSRWVGAWWLGFIIAGTVSLLAAIPFCFLPKSLEKPEGASHDKTSSVLLEERRATRKTHNSAKSKPKKWSVMLKDFCTSLKTVLSNKMYITLLCSSLLQFSSFIGFLTYKPKYLEQQYGQSTSKSNFIIGLTSLPPVGIGIFLGGLIMKKYKMGITGAAKFAFSVSFLAFLLTLLHFFVGCENHVVAGLTVSYDGKPIQNHGNTLFSECNSGCKCASNVWDPVCGDNGITYVSACLAGCTASVGHGKNMVYHNCSCLQASGSQWGNNSATLGQCPKSDACSRNFIYYTAIQVLSGFFYALGGTPAFMIMFRCVQPELKSLAVGLHTLVMRTLAGIPAPVYFGALIDRTCLKWGSRSCGLRGACRIYDSNAYRYAFLGLSAVLRAPSYLLGILFIIIVNKHYQAKQSRSTENGGREEVPMNKEDNFKSSEPLTGSIEAENESCIQEAI